MPPLGYDLLHQKIMENGVSLVEELDGIAVGIAAGEANGGPTQDMLILRVFRNRKPKPRRIKYVGL
jgi:hypothetical protein